MPAPSTPPYRLSLLGPWDLRGPDGTRVASVLSQPKRLCLLAYLAMAGEPVTRAQVVALFWPESNEEKARNALSQAIHYLRRSLSKAAVVSIEGDRIVVPPEAVWFDARELLSGGTGASGEILAEPAGDFFAGWNAEDSQPLQEWLDSVRRRVAVAERGAGLANGHQVAEGARVEAGLAEEHGARQSSTRVPAVRVAWWRWLVLALVVALIVIFGRFALQPLSSRGGTTASAPTIAVLIPRISTTEGARPISSEAIQAEIAARFTAVDGVRVESLPFDIDQLRRLVRDQARAPGAPEWVVSVIVLGGEGRARVVSTLLSGPGYTETTNASSVNLSISTGEEALLDLPREIAADVVKVFGDEVQGAARRPSGR